MCIPTFSYVGKYDLEEPSDDIQFVLKRIAVKLGKTQRVTAITGVGKKKKPISEKLGFTRHCYFNGILVASIWGNKLQFREFMAHLRDIFQCFKIRWKCSFLVSPGNITVTVPNYTAAAYDFIRAFRKGELGQVMLDNTVWASQDCTVFPFNSPPHL